MAFGGGGGVRHPPLSGGSKLNSSTCGVEKKISTPGLTDLFFDQFTVTLYKLYDTIGVSYLLP